MGVQGWMLRKPSRRRLHRLWTTSSSRTWDHMPLGGTRSSAFGEHSLSSFGSKQTQVMKMAVVQDPYHSADRILCAAHQLFLTRLAMMLWLWACSTKPGSRRENAACSKPSQKQKLQIRMFRSLNTSSPCWLEAFKGLALSLSF